MDPVLSALVDTLIAGARAAASETASQALKDAYQDLKTILVDVGAAVRGRPIGRGESGGTARRTERGFWSR
jgi:hypothetical protein